MFGGRRHRPQTRQVGLPRRATPCAACADFAPRPDAPLSPPEDTLSAVVGADQYFHFCPPSLAGPIEPSVSLSRTAKPSDGDVMMMLAPGAQKRARPQSVRGDDSLLVDGKSKLERRLRALTLLRHSSRSRPPSPEEQ